ncbi:hypothetical protein THAOC_05024 [Thalassiosira oceanica]|uniref:Uncharacterized protein n=1 Tax=Thalassiosira oceanica TaxID=159749 RepID=K0TNB1_THAOC|nr:hypothetical protein THAOC_05024 [Thalassiosira oceanica]|eukprot:EJK73357.1 hypothetical protein THAOC_05024 [Thalassiosira oceanica]
MQANVGFVVVLRQTAPFLVGRALPKALSGRLVREGPLLAGLGDPEPGARPPELHQPVRVEVRSALNDQVRAQAIKRGARQQPGPFVIARGRRRPRGIGVLRARKVPRAKAGRGWRPGRPRTTTNGSETGTDGRSRGNRGSGDGPRGGSGGAFWTLKSFPAEQSNISSVGQERNGLEAGAYWILD